MDEVAPDLYVGTLSDAGDADLLRESGVDRVVSLTHSNPESGFPDYVSVDSFGMMDGPRNSREVFEEAVRSVCLSLGCGEGVLVHCSRGASRSPCVAATAWALQNDIGIEEAFQGVAGNREEVDPHDALVRRAVKVFENLRD